VKTLRSVVLSVLPERQRRRLARLRSKITRNHDFYERARRHEFMRCAFVMLSFNGIDGDYAEFGSYGGMTFSLAFKESRKRGMHCTLWSFDSFCGLPPQEMPEDEHPYWIAGTMSTSLITFHAICKENGLRPNDYRVVPGFYRDTIAHGLAGPRNIALAYIDCDLYSSTKAVLEYLKTRLKHGMILAFDDYFCHSKTQISGERKAFLELQHETAAEFSFLPYLSIGWHGMSFIIENRE
jgi:O-methyltransferase